MSGSPISKRRKDDERGAVLIVTAGVLFVITLMAVTFAQLARLELAASRASSEDLQAALITKAALEHAIQILDEDKYGTDAQRKPYSNDRGDSPGDFAEHLAATNLYGNDEGFDHLREEWMPGGSLLGVQDDANNDVDTDNADGDADFATGRDAQWFTWRLPSGLVAQYAIYITDFGASRLNVNATGNRDGASDFYRFDGGRSTFDVRLGDDTHGIFTEAQARIIIGDSTASEDGRHGPDSYPANGVSATAAELYCLNPRNDDVPYGAETAAELLLDTGHECRLEAMLGQHFNQFQSGLASYWLTPWSFDTVVRSNPPSAALSDLRRVDVNAATEADLATLLSSLGISTAAANQLAANIVDYRDDDNSITTQGTKYGLEPHPYITEAYYNVVEKAATTWKWQYRIELYNPFDTDIQLDGNWKLRLSTDWYQGGGSDWAQGTVNPTDLTLSSYVIAARQYAILGCDAEWNASTSTLSYTQGTVNPADLLVAGMKIYGYAENNNDADPAPTHDLYVELLDGSNLIMDIAMPSSATGGFAAQPSTNEGVSRERRFYQSEQDIWWVDSAVGGLPKHTLDIGGASPPDPGSSVKLMYIANQRIYSLGELGEIATFGFQTSSGTPSTDYDNSSDPYPYTRNATYIGDPDDLKLSLFSEEAKQLFDRLMTYDPAGTDYNSYDDDGDGTANDDGTAGNDIGGAELQVPGRININTASVPVLKSLPILKTGDPLDSESMGDTIAAAIVQYRDTLSQGRFMTIGEILNVTGLDSLGTDTADNDQDGLTDEKDEKDAIIKSIANLITVRTNVFAVYAVGRVLNSAQTDVLGQRRLVAIVDRSVDPIAVRYFRWMND